MIQNEDSSGQALPPDEKITRRDFVGGALVGSGATLLGMASPGAIREAAAQTVPAPMTGLGPDWTGPGGIGDYARSNGNTHEVVNEAHAGIRNHNYDQLLRAAADTGEQYDVVIVGTGQAGLYAGWTLRKGRPDASVLLLDQHPVFGGEAKQNEFEVDGYHLTAPQGATGIVVPYRRAKEVGQTAHYYEDLGFPEELIYQKPENLSSDYLVPNDAWTPMHIGWERADTGFFYGDKCVKNPWRDGLRHLPVSAEARDALLRAELFRTPPRRQDWERFLDSMTYEQFLREVVGIEQSAMPEVTRYLNPVMAAMGCGLGADVISALSAYYFLQPGTLGYGRYQFDGIDVTDTLYLASFPGGHAGTARHMLKKFMPRALAGSDTMAEILNGAIRFDQLDRPGEQVRMRLASTVVSVAHEGDPASAKGVIVTYRRGNRLYKVRARGAILCSQQHVNRNICRDLSPEYRAAMAQFHHAPMLTVNIALRNWKFLDRMGIAAARWFEGFGWWVSLRRNLEIPGQKTQPLDPAKPVVLTMYNPFPLPGVPFPQQCTLARMQLFGMSYSFIEKAVREQFTKMFSAAGFDANRDIAGIITNRWGHAYVVDPPYFVHGKGDQPAPRNVIRERFGRLTFGHSELSGLQLWDTAAGEGERAAQQMLEIL